MKRRFKTRKRKNKRFLWFLLLAIVTFYITYKFIFLYLIKNYIKEENLVAYLTSTEGAEKGIKDPKSLLFYSFNNMLSEPKLLVETNEIPTSIEYEKPIVYLYNTHQQEKYSKEYLELYNITPTVLTASYILEEKLDNLGIETITEERSIEDVLNKQNLLYKDSYVASRYYLEDIKRTYPTLNYFIDIHRDSSPKEKTTINIDGNTYAKVLFVIGKEHNNYEENLNFANTLNNKLKEYNEELSRGVYIKEGMLVNGIYNQDFNSNTILIEIGGVDNNIEEVNNTINILSKVLKEIIG